jgi:integrase
VRCNTLVNMATFKTKLANGKYSWGYNFPGPGSTRAGRAQIKKSGFATKGEAIQAESERRIEVQKQFALSQAKGKSSVLPKTLSDLLAEFFLEHADKKLAAKTTERYREMALYLAPDLLALPIEKITSMHLTREWNRLLASGGHTRGKNEPRPLSAKSVRNIAGVVSSAFKRGIKWGLAKVNPATTSDLPQVASKKGMALTPEQQTLLIEAASGCWCIRPFLELDAATGARRGEVLALRWSDYVNGAVFIARSLSQTKKGLEFKGTKTEEPRAITLPESAIDALAAHRAQQDQFRKQFGPDYRTDLDLVFANPDGTPLRPDSISSSVSALFKRLKMAKPKGAALHLLRHSHGSHLLASGMEITAVSARLGHSNPFVTATVYSHVVSGRDQEAARRWEEFQKKNTSATQVRQ